MATLSYESGQQQKAPSPPEATRRRVSQYLQGVGLPAKQANEAAGRIVRAVLERRNPPAEDLTDAAVEQALETVAHWLDEIAASAGPASGYLRPQLAWFLRPGLTQHPEAFLHTNDLHEGLRRAIQAAARPILPAPAPVAMVSQSLGELPRLWHGLLAYTSMIWERWTRMLGRRGGTSE